MGYADQVWAKQPNKVANKPAGKHAEKASVKSNLPVEDLLQDFLRQSFAPNSNDGNNYYVGLVMKVITSNDENLYLYDIFEDSLVNQERFSNDTNKKEKEKTIKVVVHIPELFSIGHNIIVPGDPKFLDALHYASSFKVLYHGNDKINVGNYVKIVFKNNQSFKDPEIVSIYRADSEAKIVNYANNRIIQAFQSELNCRVDQLSGSQAPSSNINLITLSNPTIGYYQFFNSLEALLSKNGQDSFKRNYIDNPAQEFSFSDLEVTITVSKKIESTVGNNTIVKKNILSTKDSEDYLIKITLEHPKSEFISKYSSFIEKNITSYQFTSNGSEFYSEGTGCIISIDILAFKQKDGEVPSIDTYIKNSEEFKNSGIAVVAEQDIEIPQQNTGTVTMNTTMDTCQNQAPGNKELYYDYDLKYKPFVELLLQDKKLVKLPWKYATEIIKTEDLLELENLKISSQKILKNQESSVYKFEELLKINKSFYTYPQRVLNNKTLLTKSKANSNFSDSKKHFILEEAIDARLHKIKDFLIKLRSQIAVNEGIPPSSVLILPINVIKARTPGKQDYEFSRHYFGSAVDFIVIIKFIDGSIKQIPPLIVYLYCKKVVGNEKNNTGNGIYEKYNHFEYLNYQRDEESPKDVLKGLSDDERDNGKIWVYDTQLQQDLKKINDQPIKKMDQNLVNYAMKKFGSITTGQTIDKISKLTR